VINGIVVPFLPDKGQKWLADPLRAYPNNPAARKAIKAQAKCKKAR